VCACGVCVCVCMRVCKCVWRDNPVHHALPVKYNLTTRLEPNLWAPRRRTSPTPCAWRAPSPRATAPAPWPPCAAAAWRCWMPVGGARAALSWGECWAGGGAQGSRCKLPCGSTYCGAARTHVRNHTRTRTLTHTRAHVQACPCCSQWRGLPWACCLTRTLKSLWCWATF